MSSCTARWLTLRHVWKFHQQALASTPDLGTLMTGSTHLWIRHNNRRIWEIVYGFRRAITLSTILSQMLVNLAGLEETFDQAPVQKYCSCGLRSRAQRNRDIANCHLSRDSLHKLWQRSHIRSTHQHIQSHGSQGVSTTLRSSLKVGLCTSVRETNMSVGQTCQNPWI